MRFPLFLLFFLFLNKVWEVSGSINLSGLDTKNVKTKEKEFQTNQGGKNNDRFFETIKDSYRNVNVIALSTSRHFYNYRHTSNLLLAYKYLKSRGDVMDKNLMLMVPFDQACDCRNIKAGTIVSKYTDTSMNGREYIEEGEATNLYQNLNIDYKYNNVRDEQIQRVMRHRYDGFIPKKYRFYVNEEYKKNLFIYMTGHGGTNFLKIQEFNILSTSEFDLYLRELLIKNYYKYIFAIIDTCQGYSFYDNVLDYLKKHNISNVFLLSSSSRTENSISLFSSKYLSVSTVDRFTFHFFNYLENIWKIYTFQEAHKAAKNLSMTNVMNYLKTQEILSQPTVNIPKFSLSMFLHDKNILYYNSSFVNILKDIYDFEYTKEQVKKEKERLSHTNICLGHLAFCGHIQKQIYYNMIDTYEQTSYYKDRTNYYQEETYFTDYIFSFSEFDTSLLRKWLFILSGTYIIPFFLYKFSSGH